MNLKDRLNKEEKKPENSTDTMQTSNSQSAEQTLLSKVQELSAALTAVKDDLEREKRKSRAQDRTISKLSSRNSTLISKTQEQQSMIAALRTEISETQDINRSLRKDNQALTQENENIRFDHGVESRREFDDLRDEISRLHSQIDDLNKQVDHSNVAAVKKAYDEIEEHDRMAQKTMKDFQAFVKQKVRGFVDEIEERNRIIKSLQLRIKAQKCSLWFSRDLLIVYALCSLVADPTILLDLRNILVSMDLLLEEYSEWICCPCYIPYPGAEPLPYESGSAWAVRTVSIVAGVAFAAGIACLCRHVYTRIRAQWCRLAARVTVSLLIIVTTLGAVIKEHLQWNTAALSFVLFIVVMKLMHRLEVSYSHAHKTDEWERIKDHNNKSFYVTYHVYRLLSHERSWGREKEKQV